MKPKEYRARRAAAPVVHCAGARAASPDPKHPPAKAPGPGRAGLRRLLQTLLPKAVRVFPGESGGPGSREARLRDVAGKLGAILAALDDLGMQRAAIDVCMAHERIRARIDDDMPAESKLEQRARR